MYFAINPAQVNLAHGPQLVQILRELQMRFDGKTGQRHVLRLNWGWHKWLDGMQDGGRPGEDVLGGVPKGEAFLHAQRTIQGLKDGRKTARRAKLQAAMGTAEDEAAAKKQDADQRNHVDQRVISASVLIRD
jgi:hypothetical protein